VGSGDSRAIWRVRGLFLVGDVTRMEALSGPFDVSFDVGCFHCFDAAGQRAYVSEVSRLLKPGGIHLIWALDSTPSDLRLSPAAVKQIFAPGFAHWPSDEGGGLAL
jgi:hypothetical protein